jgi:hypothetical protein
MGFLQYSDLMEGRISPRLKYVLIALVLIFAFGAGILVNSSLSPKDSFRLGPTRDAEIVVSFGA